MSLGNSFSSGTDFLESGYIPVFLNPAIVFIGGNALKYALQAIAQISYFVMILPMLSLMNDVHSL